MAKTVQDILEIAYKEVGYAEKPVNITKYGAFFRSNPAQWCGLFVMWVFAQAQIKFPNTAYTPNGVHAFRNMGAYFTKGNPEPGDIVFFDFPDAIDRVSHVGICVKTRSNGNVLCIEGNTTGSKLKGSDERNGGEVAVKERARNLIVGWGRPMYKEAPAPIVKEIRDAWVQANKPKPVKKAAKKTAKKATKKASKDE